MSNRKDLTNLKIGNLTVTRFSRIHETPSGQKKAVWLATCICGVEKEYTQQNLTCESPTQSCGCTRYTAMTKTDEHVLTTYIWNDYQGNAAAKGREFSLTKDFLRGLTLQDCYYCGRAPKPRTMNRNRKITGLYNSVDRVRNDAGYIMGNVVACCDFCNRAKSDKPLEEFVDWLAGMKDDHPESILGNLLVYLKRQLA